MTRTRLALAGLLAAVALSPASPAQAHHDRPSKEERCERKYDKLEERFREIEAKRGWEAASEWWNDKGWPRYYEKCLAP